MDNQEDQGMDGLRDHKHQSDRDAANKDMENLGAGSKRMMEASMLGMPLGAFVTYGRMSREALGNLIMKLNSKK